MTRYRRKRTTVKNKFWKRARNKKGQTYVDQIKSEILSGKRSEDIEKKIDLELPAAGQIECIICARFFQSNFALEKHKKSKLHKKQQKRIDEPIYTQVEADLAGGIGRD